MHLSQRDARYEIVAVEDHIDYLPGIPISEKEHEEIERKRVNSIFLNGANIQSTTDRVSYKIVWEDTTKQKINKVLIELQNTNLKLGDLFDRVPYGTIKKNITGIGATTLELKAWRNSIIVMPTKALAYAKAKTGYDETLQKNKYLYVGTAIGDFQSITDEDIERYLNDPQIKYKKFLVVADSLPKLLSHFSFPYRPSTLNHKERLYDLIKKSACTICNMIVSPLFLPRTMR